MTVSGELSVTDKMVNGTLWMFLSKFIERGLGLVSTLILLRLLSPDDFGLVAMAMVVYGLIDVFVTFGFDVVLIQTKNIERGHYDTAWTLQIIFYCIVAVVLALLASVSAEYFGDLRLENVVFCLSFLFVISSLSNVGVVEFRRDLNFRKEFLFSVAKKFVALGVTVPMAFFFRSYWALVVGMLTSKVVEVLLSYWIHSFRPRLSLRYASEIMGFSKWVVFNSVISFSFNALPTFVISKFFGASSVGYYSVSKEVVDIPTTEMVAAINRSSLPGYSKKSLDLQELKRTYFSVLSVVSIVVWPIAIGIMSISEVMVPVVLGEKWLPTNELFMWLSPAAMLMALVSNSWALNASVGRPEVTGFVNFMSGIFLYSSLFYMYREDGFLWVAKSVFMFSVFYMVSSVYCSLKVLDAKVKDYVVVNVRPALSSLIMFFVVSWFLSFGLDFSDVLILLLSVVVGFLVYVSSIIFLWFAAGFSGGAESFIVSKIRLFFGF